MDFLTRQKKLRQHLATTRFDALLISHLPNIRYLCGFTGSAGILFIDDSRSIFFTDVRYDTQGREEVKGAKVVIAHKALFTALAEWLASHKKKGKARTIGVEAEHMTVAEKKKLSESFPAREHLRDATTIVERLRMVKDAGELQSIRSAVKLGATLFDRAVQVIRPGMKETDLAAEMEFAARRSGAAEMSFPTIIASGTRSALPHGRASSQAIPAGAFVVCDFGVILGGYCSDQTRTVWVGKGPGGVPADARRAYEAVKEAQEASILAVRPGISVADVDEAGRSVLRKARLDKYFTHSTGHGVGLEIHEAPRVAAGQKEILRSGMVITIEPGVYFPGKWGIRIEDMVAVNDNGREVLTPTSKDFLAV
jgi:Xaa-Pro aminopeptidase